MATKVGVPNKITLKGSTDIVAEFFMYGIHSILYQRGIYPAESFKRQEMYGLTLLVSTNEELHKYLNNLLTQVKEWLSTGMIQKLVMVIKNTDTNEVVERWQFDVECDKANLENVPDNKKSSKSVDDVKKDIAGVIRQITATVTFLPLLDCSCRFEIISYTDKDTEVPAEWGECGPMFIPNSEEVRLRSFTTGIHKVDSMVAYATGTAATRTGNK